MSSPSSSPPAFAPETDRKCQVVLVSTCAEIHSVVMTLKRDDQGNCVAHFVRASDVASVAAADVEMANFCILYLSHTSIACPKQQQQQPH